MPKALPRELLVSACLTAATLTAGAWLWFGLQDGANAAPVQTSGSSKNKADRNKADRNKADKNNAGTFDHSDMGVQSKDKQDNRILRYSKLPKPASKEEEALCRFKLSQKNSILAKNPNDVAALSARAHNYLRLRNIKAAAQDLDKALKLNPHDEDTLNVTYILVEAYIRDLEEENALHYFDLLIRSLPKESRLYSERGELLHGIGKNNEALADDTRAIELDPTNGPAYFSRGEVKCSLGDMAGAIPDFGKAATLADNKYAPLLRQAECYEVLKDWKNSAINCNKMIALKTIDVVDRLKAVLRRGNDYVEMGDKENALKDFSTVIAAPREATMRIERTTQANEQLTALHGRALIYTERKQYDLAIKDYTRMISNEEEWGEHTPNWYTERANLYRKLGKNDLAKRDEDMAKTWSKAKR